MPLELELCASVNLMLLNLKIKLMVALFRRFASVVVSPAIANEYCNALSNDVNYTGENRVNSFCFDSDVISGYSDHPSHQKRLLCEASSYRKLRLLPIPHT